MTTVMDKLAFKRPLEKVVKDVLIAKSGIYQYAKSELPGLGLDYVPKQFEHKQIFNVYRPAVVLAKACGLFTRLPITDEHPNNMLTNSDFKRHIVGYTGDSSTIEQREDGEVYIRSTVSLLDSKVVAEYENGKREVSPGYYGRFVWVEGETNDGTPYEIIMTAIEDVNHLAVVRNGRGGATSSILDHKGVQNMKLITNLFHNVFSRKRGVVDKEACTFRKTLTDSIMGNVVDGIEKAKKLMTYLPASDGKDMLSRYLEDLAYIQSLPEEEERLEAINVVANLFEKLDSEAMEEYMKERPASLDSEQITADATEEEVKETSTEETSAEDTSEEVVVDEEVKTTDEEKAESKEDETAGEEVEDTQLGAPNSDPETTPGVDDAFDATLAGMPKEQFEYLVAKVVDSVTKALSTAKEVTDSAPSAVVPSGVTMDTFPGSGDSNSKQSIEEYFYSDIKKKR